MDNFEELIVARRGMRLIRDSRMKFSVLNWLVVLGLVALIFSGIAEIFKG